MYIIIRSNYTTTTHSGNWPQAYLEERLNNGDELIVISLYSDTIKVPVSKVVNGETEWEFTEYPLPKELRQ